MILLTFAAPTPAPLAATQLAYGNFSLGRLAVKWLAHPGLSYLIDFGISCETAMFSIGHLMGLASYRGLKLCCDIVSSNILLGDNVASITCRTYPWKLKLEPEV